MGDVFIERMVKKRFESKDGIMVVLILVAAVVVFLLSFYFLTPIAGIMIPFLVLVGACYGTYKLLSMRNLEFEYSLTNGYISIDKIMNKSSRKRLTAFECNAIEEMGEYPKNQTRLQNREVQTKVFASEYADGRNAWYVIVNAKKTGRTLVVFDPDEDLLDAVKKFMPTHLRFELFGRR